MKRLITTFSLLLLLTSLTACTKKGTEAEVENSQENAQESEANLYESRKVSFNYPDGWVLRESDTPVGRVIILYAPTQDDEGVQTNLNIILQDLNGAEEKPTLKSYTENAKKSLKEIVQNLEILSQDTIKISGHKGTSLSYKGSTEKKPEKEFQWWQAWTLLEDTAYIFTLTGDSENIDDYQKATQFVLDSFEIK